MRHDYEMGRTIAAIYDLAARSRGCSAFERRLRDCAGVHIYGNDASKREFAILVEVNKRNSSDQAVIDFLSGLVGLSLGMAVALLAFTAGIAFGG